VTDGVRVQPEVEKTPICLNLKFEVHSQFDLITVVKSIELKDQNQVVSAVGVFTPFNHLIGSC